MLAATLHTPIEDEGMPGTDHLGLVEVFTPGRLDDRSWTAVGPKSEGSGLLGVALNGTSVALEGRGPSGATWARSLGA